MSDEVKLPTEEELKRLSFRACVAYAVRASLRVRPPFRSDDPDVERATDAANQIAIDFAAGTVADVDAQAAADRAQAAVLAASDIGEERAADAAFTAAQTAEVVQAICIRDFDLARNTARIVARAATDAAGAEPVDVAVALQGDYGRLLDFSGHAAGELGNPIDVKSDRGPLYMLWPHGKPDWCKKPNHVA